MAAVGCFLIGCDLFDPGRKQLRWQQTGPSCPGTPAVGPDGTIYVGGSIDGVLTFDSTGTPGPALLAGQDCRKLVVASNTRLYVLQHTYDNLILLTALDPVGGEQAWQCIAGTCHGTHSQQNLAAALAADGTVYVPACGSLVAVNPNGTIRWRFWTGAQFCYPPVIGPDGTVYAPLESCCVAIDSSGSERWRYQLPGKRPGPLAVGQDGVVYSCWFYQTVAAINPDGTERWRSKLGVYPYGPVVVDEDGALYFGNGSDTLYCLNSDGTVRWRRHQNPAPAGSCAIGPDGTVYFIGVTGGDGWPFESPVKYHVLAYSPDGNRLWAFSAKGCVLTDPCLGPANTLIVSVFGGDLCAFAAPGSGRNHAWPMYQHDPAHTGQAGQ